MIGLETLVEYFLVFFGMLLCGVAGTGAVMKTYELICKTSDALAETRTLTAKMIDKLEGKKEE